ncbi:hypothetical protein ZIOFF_035407 [Zingiber officinale]|uniref:Piwi domain-containing protein n=1 Tax=Zingiber officinale TaxID=94328 RepID=A0A8J5GML7_ZINOF|nr:hypothetical protein ZIOFF_035407 [Zingiber officinale]
MADGFRVMPLLILCSLFQGILGEEHQPNHPTERILVSRTIKCGGLAVTKAASIKNILRALKEKRGESCLEYLRSLFVDEIKAELSKFKGIGQKMMRQQGDLQYFIPALCVVCKPNAKDATTLCGRVNSWICINFTKNVQDNLARGFCHELAQMCQISGMPDHVERVLSTHYHDAMTILQPQGKELDLLIVILPDNDGSLYGALYCKPHFEQLFKESVLAKGHYLKFQIAHYGRTPAKIEELASSIECPGIAMSASQEEKKCSFITPSSDPMYVSYHDEEWGVPVHDDRMLFELLVLIGAQVGMDWTTILKKRNEFRVAFAEFDVESVSKFTEKQMVSISVELKLDLGRVRGISLSTLKQNYVDALSRRIPLVSDRPTLIFGADVTHPHPGEDSSPSIAVVCSIDSFLACQQHSKYRVTFSLKVGLACLLVSLLILIQAPY